MADLIERQAVKKMIKNHRSDFSTEKDYRTAMACAHAVPSAQPKRENGKWVLSEHQRKEETDNGNYSYICSRCGRYDLHAVTQIVPFCWWCGADMRGRE